MLQLDRLTKTYGSQTAVSDLSFQVLPGEVVGFLGPNGAGKSSTMKMICGYLPATAGSVQVAGLDVKTDSLAVRKRIGYLPEHNPLYLDLYVREALRYAAALAGVPSREIAKRVQHAIEMTGLSPEAHKPLGALSKGYRQRAGLAQALLHNPDLLILDEPTTGLDPNQVQDIRSLIRELGKTKAVVFSSHILQEVEAVATRVVVIHKGTLRYDGPVRPASDVEGWLELAFEQDGFSFAPLQAEGMIAQLRGSGRSWQVQPMPGVDLRQRLVAESVAQDNALVRLTRPEANLEALFRRLTQD